MVYHCQRRSFLLIGFFLTNITFPVREIFCFSAVNVFVCAAHRHIHGQQAY